MKWTTFLFLIFVLQAFGQSEIAFLQTTPTPTTALPKMKVYASDTAIPLRILRGLAFVDASIDQIPGKFLLDTGAPYLVINQKVTSQKTIIQASSFANHFQIGSAKVNDFQWSSIRRKSLDALVLDINHLNEYTHTPVAGIIGYDLLKSYEVYIDYPNAQVLLLTPGKNKLHIAAEPLATIEFELQDHLPVVTVQINGQTFRLGLDTGAGVNLLDARHQANLLASLEATIRETSVRAIDQSTNLRETAVLESTQLSGLNLGEMSYLFSDLSHLEATTLKIDGLLGFPFFKKVKCSIDYPNRKLHIWSIQPDVK